VIDTFSGTDYCAGSRSEGFRIDIAHPSPALSPIFMGKGRLHAGCSHRSA